MLRGWKTKPCAHQDWGKGAVTTRDWTSPAFECLSVSCGGSGQPWSATGTGALAAPDLGGEACGIKPLGGVGHSVQSFSHVCLFVTSWTAACQASVSITNSQSLLKLMPIESGMPSHHLILCHPFSYHLQSFPASGSFQMSQFFASGDQSIGVSASASVLPMNIQDWFPLGWTSWISLQSKGLSRVFSNTTV